MTLSNLSRPLICALLLAAAGAGHGASLNIEGAELRWMPNRAAFEALGIEIIEAETPDIWRLESRARDIGKVAAGEPLALPAAGIGLGGGPVLRWPAGEVDLRTATLVPTGNADQLALVDDAGRKWFVLDMGHQEFRPDIPALGIHMLDVRLAPAFAAAIGAPRTAGAYLGAAEIDITLGGPPARPKGPAILQCETAVWPTEPDADADLEMIDIPGITETATDASRAAGRVIVTPAARFENVGTADLPWFQVFLTPDLDPEYCCDAGNGTCEPYANDQQGLLVWNLYRLEDDRLEQIGRSGVKHAFNSTNDTCTDPSRRGDARIAWSGCTDTYTASTNVLQRFLGHRDPVLAHPVLFDRIGSVFDLNGDDDCDNPDTGFVKCHASPTTDVFDRRLSVPESDLERPGARYFMEAWYLVRDDINIFNSFGFQEVAPEFVPTSGSGMWTFPFVGGFRNGPVASVAAADAGFDIHPIDTGSGWIDVATRVDPTGDAFRYHIAVMNYDFDAGLDRLILELDPSVQIGGALFFDGDDDPDNQWTVAATPTRITWRTFDNPLVWGTMFSFEYESAFAPSTGTARVRVADGSGDTWPVQIPLPTPGPDFVFGSGFEPRIVND